MRSRLRIVSGRAWLPAVVTLLAIVAGGCGNALLPSTNPPSVGLSTTSTNAITAGVPVGFVVTTTNPGNAANIFVTSIHMDFGDGVVADLGAVPGTVSHPYASVGAYIVTATVTDTTGNQGRASLTIYVNPASRPPAPSVGLTSTATNPTPVGTVVTFTVTASIPGNPTGVNIQNTHLDFGDGFAVDLGGASSSTATHSYATAGTFAITAIATDTSGSQGRAQTVVVVGAAAKTAPPSVGLTSTVASPTPVGTVITFTVAASFPGNPANVFIQSIHVDFGDGQSAELGATPGSVTHAYALAATYTATATVTDTNGNAASASLAVVVK